MWRITEQTESPEEIAAKMRGAKIAFLLAAGKIKPGERLPTEGPYSKSFEKIVDAVMAAEKVTAHQLCGGGRSAWQRLANLTYAARNNSAKAEALAVRILAIHAPPSFASGSEDPDLSGNTDPRGYLAQRIRVGLAGSSEALTAFEQQIQPLPATLGDMILALRHSLGLSQRNFPGLNQGAVVAYERGTTGPRKSLRRDLDILGAVLAAGLLNQVGEQPVEKATTRLERARKYRAFEAPPSVQER